MTGRERLTSLAPRIPLAVCSLAVLFFLLSLVAIAAACESSAEPVKAPEPATTAGDSGSSDVHACPASTRYNPKTHSCDRIHF